VRLILPRRKWHALVSSILVLMLAIGVPLAAAPTVSAQTATAATISVERDYYAPGETLSHTGAGFRPEETVNLRMVSASGESTITGQAVSTGAGTISGQLTLSDDYEPSYTLTATGTTSGLVAVTTFRDDITVANLSKNAPNPEPSTIALAGPPVTFRVLVKNGSDNPMGNAPIKWTVTGGTKASDAGLEPLGFASSQDCSKSSTNSSTRGLAGITFTPTSAGSGSVKAEAYSDNPNGCNGSILSTVTWNFTITSPPPSDTTAPTTTITLDPATASGSDNWYTGAVKVTVAATDNTGGSGVAETRCVLNPASAPASFDAIPSGCAYTSPGANVSVDGQHVVYAASKDTAGNKESVRSQGFKIDTIKPAISAAVSAGTVGSNGWYTSDVTVHFTCADALSGVADGACPADQLLNSEGDSVSSTAKTVADNAGNVSDLSNVVTVKIDKTRPTITASANPGPNANGWNKGSVTVSFTCSDGTGSGLAGACPTAQTFTDEGTHTVNARTVTDTAGNVSEPSNIVTVKIDKTSPLLSGAPTTLANGEGWYKANVEIAWTCSDALSGIAGDGSCPANSTISSEGAGLKASATVSDKAGNTTNADSSPLVNIDKTPPTVSVTGVTNGGTYTLGTVPTAGCSTTDPLSGPKVLATVQVTGPNSPVGTLTATCTGAQDKAGNGQASPVSVTYTVTYNWTGFFQPIDNQPTVNKAKAGSSIPVKFNLGGNQGLEIFAAGYPRAVAVNCTSGAVLDDIEETVTAGGSSLTYDATAKQYVYVWKTLTTFAGTCQRLDVTLKDGTTHSANFSFVK
jgi:hypothetical protein